MELNDIVKDGVNLSEMFPPQDNTSVTPEPIIRDRSAKLAIVSSPVRDPVITYQTLWNEAGQGINSTAGTIEQEIRAKNSRMDLKSVSNLLADPTLTTQQKQQIVTAYSKQQSDPLNIEKELLIKAASENTEKTSPEHNSKINTIMDRIDAVNQSAAEQQRIKNSFAAGLDADTSKAFADLMESVFVPFANNKMATEVLQKMRANGEPVSPGSFLSSFMALGGTLADLNKAYRNLPAEKQTEFVRSLAEVYKNSSAIIGGNDFIKFQQFLSVTNPEGYGTVEKWMDNITPYLDAIGLGSFIKGLKPSKSVSNNRKLPTPLPSDKNKVEPVLKPQERNIFEPATVSSPPSDVSGINKELDSLINQRASLLGDSSGLAERGDISQINSELEN